MPDKTPPDILVSKSVAAYLLEGITENVLPGQGTVARVREDIVAMFQQRIGTEHATPPETLSTLGVLTSILEERRSQRSGPYNDDHDDQHENGELARFAAAMVIPEPLYRLTDPKTLNFVSVLPIEEVPEGDGDGGKEYRPWKVPVPKDKDRVDLYIKAAAVLVAEVERLLRVRNVERCAVEARRIATQRPENRRNKRKPARGSFNNRKRRKPIPR